MSGVVMVSGSLRFGILVMALLVMGGTRADLITDEDVARAWLDDYNSAAQEAYYADVLASWNYNTNITDYNQQVMVEQSLQRSLFVKEAADNTTLFDWENFQDEDTKRQFSKLAVIGTAKLPPEEVEQVDKLNADMERIYSTARVCNKPGDSSGNCYPLDPDLTRILAQSRDWEELSWAWKGWRDVTGKEMIDMYPPFVDLQNKAAELNGFEDNGDYWRSWYEMDGFEEEVARLWNQVKPLYQHLHAYVRRKLMTVYGEEKFPSTGHIPANILGNMWAQSWTNILSLVQPYPNHTSVDVTDALVQQNYDAHRMFVLSEEFFTSIGLKAMPQEFWDESMIVKPEERDVVCHASAWDFYNQKDFRIKQCTDITMDWLLTTHHEMGHVQYFLQYAHHPVMYRGGANPGFHEAVGDVMSLSVSTPEHLYEIGLLDSLEQDEEADINFLMSQALKKIAFLPFGYLIDQWRWSVFKGDTKPEQYNHKWWDLRCGIQGVSPPVMRSEEDFDPGAKFHIPGNTPYIRYFVSFILQFQMHKSLCELANSTASLHRCDIYRSHEAGEKLGDMLKLGSSVEWPKALSQLTGTDHMDASALVEYFQPLIDWLEEQNKGYDISWDESACPEGSFIASHASFSHLNPVLWAVLLASIFITIRRLMQ